MKNLSKPNQSNIIFTLFFSVLLFTIFSFPSTVSGQNNVCQSISFDRSSYLDNMDIQRSVKILDAYGTEFLPTEISYVNPPAPAPNFFLLPANTTCAAGLFTIHFSDEPTTVNNYGFSNAALGQARRNVVCQVFTDLSVLLHDVTPANQGRVHIWVGSDQAYTASLPGVTYPAGAGALASQFYVTPIGLNNAIIDGEVYKTIRSGQNSYNGLPAGFIPQNSDGIYHGYIAVDLSTSSNWYLDFTNTAIGVSQIDLYSVILHEAIHALGFSSNITSTGLSKWNADNPDVYFRFDRYLSRNTVANRLISYVGLNNWQYILGAPALPQTCATPNNIIFSGNNLNNQAVYNATGWSDGSNLSHFGCSGTTICDAGYNAPTSNFVMNPCSGPGVASIKRRPNAQEVRALCDLGYVLRNTGGTIAYGNNINNNTIYQTYTACSNSCIALGIHDAFNTAFTTPLTRNFSVILGNDVNGANGTVNEIFVITPNAGTITTTGAGANNSFTFTPANNFSGIAVIGYYPRCNGSNENGSLTYIFITVENPPLPPCINNGSCNLICDGDFEFADRSSSYSDLDVQGINSNSTDLFFLNPQTNTICVRDWNTGNAVWCNMPANHGGGCSFGTSVLNLAPNGGNQFIGIGGHTTNVESIHLRLRQNMTTGNTYQLRFQGRFLQNTCPNATIEVYGDDQPPCPINQTTLLNGTSSVCGFTAANLGSTVINTSNWSNYLINITPNQTISDLVFRLTPLDGSYGYFDNFELFQINATAVQITATPLNSLPCVGTTQTINYQICLPQGTAGTNPNPINLQLNLPQGFTVGAGSGFNAQGQATIPANTISSVNCANLTLNVQIAGNVTVGIPYQVELSAIGTGCVSTTSNNIATMTPINNPLAISKTASNNNPAIGSSVTYSIQVCNSSLLAVNNVTITDVLPAGLTVQNLNGFTQNGNTLTRTVNVPAAASIGNPSCQTYSFTATVNNNCALSGTAINNCASIQIGGSNCPALQSCIAVNVQPTTASISASANVICSGVPSSVTLTASGGTTYQWSHGLGTGATKSVSPASTTTYTVTVTNAAGCTATASSTVTVGTNPVALITAEEIPGNCEHKLTASGGTAYTWSHGLGTGAVKIIKPTIPTLYSVTVTNAAGCTSVASGIWGRPTSCCTAANPALTFDGTITSTQLLTQASNILGASSVSGTTLMTGANQIVINGTLNLNSNLDFLGCTEIRFGANGNIKTNSFNLSCYTSTLKGCSDYMWKGIEINNATAQVTLREFWGGKTLIYDAEFGILNTSGGKIQAFNTEFINNYRGIAVRNAIPAFFEVYNTGFYSNSTLKLSTIANPIPIMNAGIELTDVFNTSANPITIGKVFSTRTNSNYFGYGSDNSLGAGIVIKDASVKVLNSDFRISYTYGSGYVGIGSGIHAHRTTANAMLEVGDGTPQGLNNFKTGLVGVNQAFTMNVSIRKNYFERLTTAFFASLFNHSANITFNDNTAYSPGVTQFGVLIGTSNNSVIEIQNNLLSFSNGSAAQTSNPTGISISNSTSSSSTYRITIVNNMLRQVVKGIATTNTDLPLIWGNGINIHARNYSFSNVGWAGIESTSDKGVGIQQNYIDVEPVPTPNVTYTANNTTTTKLIGVNINSTRATPAYVQCDTILNMHWGLAATGANSVGVNFTRNSLMMGNGVRVGLALYNPTIIGNQGGSAQTNDNKWYGTVNGTTNFHFGYFNTPNTSAISSQQFWFRNGYALNPTSAGAVRNAFGPNIFTTLGYNFTTPVVQLFTCYAFTQTRSGKMSEEDLQFLRWMETLVSDTLATDSLNPYFNLWREEQIMLALEENPWLREESIVLYDYYQSTGMESFLALHRLQKQADAVADSATAYLLLDENESIMPATRHEQNIQKLNALKLRHALQLFTGNLAAIRPNLTDSIELRMLAAECYVTGGPSIFAARAYWNTVYQKVDNSFQDYCFETTGYYKTDSVNCIKSNQPELFKLYPTVFERGSLLNMLSSESGSIRFSDISGKVIWQYKFEKGTNRIQLLELESSQILLYDVITVTGNKYNGKIFVR